MNISIRRTGAVFVPLCLVALACTGNSAAPGPDSPSRTTAVEATNFSGPRAFEHVRRLVELGPRPVGSPAHDRMRDYILDELRSYGLKVIRDDFTAATPSGEKSMTNIIAVLPGASENIVMVAGHYDTKYFANNVFVGANDGGSSTGALLEIARTMSLQPEKSAFTTWFVFLDGEEAFCSGWTDCLNGSDHTYGSRHLANKLAKDGQLSSVKAFVLIDMIGDRDLGIQREAGYSSAILTLVIWNTAGSLGYGQYFLPSNQFVEDDHVPFLEKGVPSVDLIDFQFPYWHTPQDTLDKISGDSMKVVGDVVIRSLPEIYNAVNTNKR